MTNTSYNLIQGLTTLNIKDIFIYNIPHATLQEYIQTELTLFLQEKLETRLY